MIQMDNSPTHGGGWKADLMNDEVYTQVKQDAAVGKYDVIFIASPCSTFSVSRFFDLPGDDPGPPVIHNLNHPDGLPWNQIPPKHHKELMHITKLIARTAEIARLAVTSPTQTTIIWENPAGRADFGSNAYCEDVPLHSTVFDTTQFKRLVSDTASHTKWDSRTFAWCRFGSDAQKYTTFWYIPKTQPRLLMC